MSEPVTRLVLVRHGETAFSLERRWSGHNDQELSEAGRAMAAAAAARLDGADAAALYASPILRARQTAAPIAAALRMEVVVEPALAECNFGTWDGLLFREVGEADGEAFTKWLRGEGRAGGHGESLGEMAGRVEQWMDDAAARHAGHTIVAVSHTGPIKAAVRYAMGADFAQMYRLQQDLGSLTVLEHAKDTWWARSVNDTAHLFEGAPLPPPGRRPFSS